MAEIQEGKRSLWAVPAIIGLVIVTSLIGVGAWDVWQCYRLGWLQRSAANAVMLADAIKTKADSDRLQQFEQSVSKKGR